MAKFGPGDAAPVFICRTKTAGWGGKIVRAWRQVSPEDTGPKAREALGK